MNPTQTPTRKVYAEDNNGYAIVWQDNRIWQIERNGRAVIESPSLGGLFEHTNRCSPAFYLIIQVASKLGRWDKEG